MKLFLSISTGQEDMCYKADILHKLLKGIDGKTVSSTEFYSILRCLREDILQFDQYYKCETVFDICWEKDKGLHVIDISTRFYSATLTAKQID
ncbi:hypothetical protein SDC9_173557 [bioreactor metagenome]|uniref:Uncharacterized protein n=1 Tax=bioreactor metagenome TaxID=1076179 RepID=A0A645GR32_9ZZZZ|nr:hypothetical protein [Proteiniphilum sp.]MEA4918121.1 hypothetical protein [Proteiniphilum sp.]